MDATSCILFCHSGYPELHYFLIRIKYAEPCVLMPAEREGRVKVLEFPIRPYQAQLPVFMVPE